MNFCACCTSVLMLDHLEGGRIAGESRTAHTSTSLTVTPPILPVG